MAKLNAVARKRIPKKEFGLPGKAPGSGSYPMPDKAHARVAKAYAARFASPAQQAQIDAKANGILGIKGHRGPVHTRNSKANGGRK